MGQPNLSRGIKDLEETLGVKIVQAHVQGHRPDAAGGGITSFTRRASWTQIEEVEALYRPAKKQ